MKKLLLITEVMLLSIASYSQTFKSSYINKTKPKFETDTKDRIVTISDKEITVTNFLDGVVKTWHLIVNKIENNDWMYDGLQKTYYCTGQDKDIISGTYRKAIAHKTSYGTFIIADFADEMTVLTYDFDMK